MDVVAGLGNPGDKYEGTRHNLGFRVIDCLAQSFRTTLSEHCAHVSWGELRLNGKRVVLAKPRTFVNLSGQGIQELLEKLSISPHELIVVHDDLDLPLGIVRLKGQGGSGGHKGITAVIASLQTDSFTRVRLGIGRPPGRQDPADYVLRPFPKRQQPQVELAIVEAAEAALSVVREGLEKAMQVVNA